MRRSEAIRRLSVRAGLSINDADFTLRCMEDLGMLPPPNYNSKYPSLIPGLDVYEYPSEWESEEDDTLYVGPY